MITKKAEYAIITLVELALQERGQKITTGSIARRRRIPVNLILPLIGLMRQAGWLLCTRGPSGGVELLRDPMGITLREVIELFDGPIGITRCLMNDEPCHNQVGCSLRGIWAKAQKSLIEVLESVTIYDLSRAKAPLG